MSETLPPPYKGTTTPPADLQAGLKGKVKLHTRLCKTKDKSKNVRKDVRSSESSGGRFNINARELLLTKCAAEPAGSQTQIEGRETKREKGNERKKRERKRRRAASNTRTGKTSF